MSRYRISLVRQGIKGFLSHQSIGTDAFNALSSINGVENLEIEAETDLQVTLSYDWTRTDVFERAGEVLAEYGLQHAETFLDRVSAA